jgi:hypothetical protein
MLELELELERELERVEGQLSVQQRLQANLH